MVTAVNRPDLFALVGQRVTVTRPGHTDPVTGRLAAYAESPHLILDLDDGQRWILPQGRCKVAPADDTPPAAGPFPRSDEPPTKSSAHWERLAIREPNGDVTYTWPDAPPVGDVVVGANVRGWPDMRTVASNLARLDDMLANLQAHIDQRATEVAQPHIEEAREAAATEVKGAQGLQQRAEDLNTELRRQLKALESQNTRIRQRAEASGASVVRCLSALSETFEHEPSEWQRGFRACALHATRALNGTLHLPEADRG